MSILKIILALIILPLVLTGVYYGLVWAFSLLSPAALFVAFFMGVAILWMAGLFVYAHYFA